MRITHKNIGMAQDTPLRWIRRKVFGVTQEELATIGGVSRPRVSRYETGVDDPPFGFMRRVRNEALTRGQPFSADWFFEHPEDKAATDEPAAAEANL